MNEIRHKREKLLIDFMFDNINEEEFEKELDKLKEPNYERNSSKPASRSK